MATNTPLLEQYAFRSQKQLGLIGGSPTYEPVEGFAKPDATSRLYQYSQDGKLFAYAVPGSIRILSVESLELVQEIAINNVIEFNLSPLGTHISTWERLVKLDDGAQHKNLRVWVIKTGQEAISFTQKSSEQWDLQYTADESRAIRLVGGEIQVFTPSDWGKGITDKLRVEGISTVSLSSGRNPSIAAFIGEKNAAPASARIYSLLSLSSAPTCQKTFYKADRVTFKWNALGTQVLVLTQTDVDKSNKSYYGETGLVVLSAAGNFDCRVQLDKEGPIHDFAWSPNSKEFGVVYGYMPAKTVLFDQRVKVLHDFGAHPRNFISFNPQGRLLALAGFGNLAGKIDIFDRRTLNKVCTIDAPNTSWCEWNTDGTHLMTATLSPRLRVDNGIKIWHCTGGLMHIQPVDELYQASWRPCRAEVTPAFPATVPIAPTPSASAQAQTPLAAPQAKPAGAYRPPGARGLATPDIYKREDEGGLAYIPRDGTATPPRRGGGPNGHPHGHGHGHEGHGNHRGHGHHPHHRDVPGAGERSHSSGNVQANGGPRRRNVPGAGPPPAETEGGAREGAGAKKPRKKKDANKKKGERGGAGGSGEGGAQGSGGVVSPRASLDDRRPQHLELPPKGLTVATAGVVPDTPALETPGGEGLDPVAKKIRNLNKKLKAIEELKERAKSGDKLEATQLKKIDGEVEIRKELTSLTSANGVP